MKARMKKKKLISVAARFVEAHNANDVPNSAWCRRELARHDQGVRFLAAWRVMVDRGVLRDLEAEEGPNLSTVLALAAQPNPQDKGEDVFASLFTWLRDEVEPRRRWGSDLAAVREGLRQRRRLGLQRYGQTLRTLDGRDHLRDLVEELQDALVYAHRLTLTATNPLHVQWAEAVREACLGYLRVLEDGGLLPENPGPHLTVEIQGATMEEPVQRSPEFEARKAKFQAIMIRKLAERRAREEAMATPDPEPEKTFGDFFGAWDDDDEPAKITPWKETREQLEALQRLVDLIQTAESERALGESEAWTAVEDGLLNGLGVELMFNLRVCAPLLLDLLFLDEPRRVLADLEGPKPHPILEAAGFEVVSSGTTPTLERLVDALQAPPDPQEEDTTPTPILIPTDRAHGHAEVVEALEELLEMARAGELEAVVVAGQTEDGGLVTTIRGRLKPLLAVGHLEELQSRILEARRNGDWDRGWE